MQGVSPCFYLISGCLQSYTTRIGWLTVWKDRLTLGKTREIGAYQAWFSTQPTTDQLLSYFTIASVFVFILEAFLQDVLSTLVQWIWSCIIHQFVLCGLHLLSMRCSYNGVLCFNLLTRALYPVLCICILYIVWDTLYFIISAKKYFKFVPFTIYIVLTTLYMRFVFFTYTYNVPCTL